MVATLEASESNLKSHLEKLTAKHYYSGEQFDPDEHRPSQIITKEQATTNAVCGPTLS